MTEPTIKAVQRPVPTPSGELEADYRRDQGNGSSTMTGYSVEARYMYHEPISVAGQLFDQRWRRVSFQESVMGVPAAPPYMRSVLEQGYLGFPAAQALRWWLHAHAAAHNTGMGLCLESRLVEHKIQASHTVTAAKWHDLVRGWNRES